MEPRMTEVPSCPLKSYLKFYRSVTQHTDDQRKAVGGRTKDTQGQNGLKHMSVAIETPRSHIDDHKPALFKAYFLPWFMTLDQKCLNIPF